MMPISRWSAEPIRGLTTLPHGFTDAGDRTRCAGGQVWGEHGGASGVGSARKGVRELQKEP